MLNDPVLISERFHLRLALRCLDQMREGAGRIADFGVDALASESLGRMRSERISQLTVNGQAPPFFGRTDRDPDPTHPAGEVFHIGRRHVRDEVGDPVVIDWRAPIARPFYRATSTDRQGVRLRRRFGFADGTLTSFEDEHLDLGEALGLNSDLLRREIERPRVGPMRDIVATIQPDQDELVRANLDTSLCIQGAPGTGKTAVGLHRAAFLLYTYPERLRRSGVLVVGPNSAFLRYISQVLPALGENGIQQTTVEELAARAPVRRTDAIEAAILKGDVRMAAILRRAVSSHIAKPAEDVVVLLGTKRYRIQVERCRRYVDDARRALASGELRWNGARERLRHLIAQDVRRQREASGGAPSDAETAKVARCAQVKAFVDAVWPAIDPRALLIRVFTEPDFARRCGADLLTAAELELLAWDAAPRGPRNAKFSVADSVLLDELAGLITGTEQYVHVVVDEAQDLSAMQCRVIARRCPLGSVTVLGDLAQATTPWATGSWPVTLGHLNQSSAAVKPLTVGYRVPAEVLTVANRLLPHIAPEVPAASSVRSGEAALTYSGDLIAAVRRCLEMEGSVAVIVPDIRLAQVIATLASAGMTASTLESDTTNASESASARESDKPDTLGSASSEIALETDRLQSAMAKRLTVVAATTAKGLEFDSVVLLEPAEIVAGEPDRISGLRRLYVAWTRAVSRLAVVHTCPLPAELTG